MLRHASEAELLDLKEGTNDSAGFIKRYAMAGGNKITFWPKPSSGMVVNIVYIAEPTAFSTPSASGAATATPSNIPNQFQWDTVVAGAMCELLEKDEIVSTGKLEYWQGKYQNGIMRIQSWMTEMGGDPTPIYDYNSHHYAPYNDEHHRGM